MESKKLKELVREIQFHSKLTLDEIAKRIGYSPSYFRNAINRGENDKLQIALLKEFKIEHNVAPVEQKARSTKEVDYQAKYIELLEKQCKDADTIKEVLINLDELQKMVVATAMNVKVNQRLIEVVSAQAGKKLNFGQEVSRIASDVSREFSEQGIGSLKSR